MFSDIGIDLGTSKTVIVSGKLILLNEPSVVLMDTYDEVPVKFGRYAQRAVGRSTDRYNAVCPIERGVIADYDVAEYMLNNYLARVVGNKLTKPRAVVAVPSNITTVERRSVIDAIQYSGIRSVCTIESPVASALGMGIDFKKPHGSILVDIGAGVTDVAVLSMGGMSRSETTKIGGDDIDDAIIKYMRREHNHLIGKSTATEIKHLIGTAIPQDIDVAMVAKGISLSTGLPSTVEITSDEICEAISDVVYALCSAIQSVVNNTPPELVGDISEDGIYLTGGTSALRGLALKLSDFLGVSVRAATNASYSVARGIGIAMQHFDILENGDYKFLTIQDLL